MSSGRWRAYAGPDSPAATENATVAATRRYRGNQICVSFGRQRSPLGIRFTCGVEGSMTMRYAHLSPDVPRQAVKLLDGIGSAATPAAAAGRQLGDNSRFRT